GLTNMQYRQLGNTGLTVSAIGFGCWEMGNPDYGRSDDNEMIAAVHRAIELGVTLFDTAPNYGFGGSEEVLGRALGARRKDIVLVSKVGITWDPVTMTTKFDGRYSTIKRINEESLRRLGTDHLDLVLMHWPDPETPIAETMGALEELRSEGKALHVGVSNFSAHELREARKYAPICANEVGYNLFDRRWEHEMFPTAAELGIGIMAYGPMAHGLLTGTLQRENAFDERDWRRSGNIFGQRLFGPNLSANLDVVDNLLTVADRIGTSLPLLALAWVLRNPTVSVALSGCRTPREIEENIRALDVTLDSEALAAIDQALTAAKGQTQAVPGRHHVPPTD
ncbi:MAG: aldo/keto reductase, partial [Chloroflexota bacterium]|nr:aldo/keto reductase [Chloroflexota bacterium]